MGSEVKNISILVVDDSEMNVELLVNILERYQYTIYTATRGEEALEKAREHLPEIVLLDINMPGLSGYEVSREMKADASLADIPIIFISALDDMDNVIEGFDAGGVDYITKPFKYREVIARVHTQVILARQKQQIEQMLERERQHYESMDKLRRQFIGSATHDLKNPLFVISGYADMLEMSPDVGKNEQLVGFVQSIQRGVDKMSGLVHDILDLLQLETEITLSKSAIDFHTFLKQSADDMLIHAQKKDIKLTIHPLEESVDIQIDVKRMGRVLDNLVTNAIKYTPSSGQVDVVGKVGHKTVVIEVIDTGLGIPSDVLPTIFEPFERVNTEEHMAQEGTGLGLSIVRTLVEQHGGTVKAESEFGKGSRFIVTIPI